MDEIEKLKKENRKLQAQLDRAKKIRLVSVSHYSPCALENFGLHVDCYGGADAAGPKQCTNCIDHWIDEGE